MSPDLKQQQQQLHLRCHFISGYAWITRCNTCDTIIKLKWNIQYDLICQTLLKNKHQPVKERSQKWDRRSTLCCIKFDWQSEFRSVVCWVLLFVRLKRYYVIPKIHTLFFTFLRKYNWNCRLEQFTALDSWLSRPALRIYHFCFYVWLVDIRARARLRVPFHPRCRGLARVSTLRGSNREEKCQVKSSLKLKIKPWKNLWTLPRRLNPQRWAEKVVPRCRY